MRMPSSLSCRTSIVIAMALGGCTVAAQVHEPGYSFSPVVADAEVQFQVIDRRNSETKVFRIEEHEGVKTYIYGDAQFFPQRIRVLATRFAKAIPGVAPETTLIVDRFDIGHRVTRGYAPGRTCDEMFSCVAGALVIGADKANPDRNLIACRLRGSFNNIAFDASYDAAYVDYDAASQPVRVVSVLYGAVDKAVNEVRDQLRVTKQISPAVEDLPPLVLPPSPWLPKGRVAPDPPPK